MSGNTNYLSNLKAQMASEALDVGIYCPKCGKAEGYFHKTLQTHTQFIGFNGAPFDCDITFVRGGTKKYCACCEKDITEFVDSLNLR